jgi:hypothetical protein
MPGIKISALPAIATVTSEDLYATEQSGVTYKVTNSQLADIFTDNYACRLATTVALSAAYDNGNAGVGATLTNNSTLGALTIDGVAVAVGDRILIKDQGTQYQNGIYDITVIGDGSTPWVMVRSTGYDTGEDIDAGDLFTIAFGDDNAKTQWIQTAPGPFTIGSTSITFESNILAGSGLTKTNNTIAISNIIAGKSADIGGGGAGPITIAVVGLTTSSVVSASIESSTNAVAVAKCTAGADEFDILFTGDPGAACIVNYIAFIVPM